MEKDLTEDGITDQVLIYDDSGTILQADMDQNQDGFFEKRQYYTNGTISRIERDLDDDHQMDCTDFFENEKRVRQEKRDAGGNLTQIALFDAEGQIQKIQKDTTGNGRFDTLFQFDAGRLIFSTKDTDGNGTVNITTFYDKQMPVRQEIDENENKTLDRIVFFDSQGQIKKILKDPYKKDRYQTTLIFENGQMKTRHRDTSKNGTADDITWFENDLPVEHKQDTNFDGRFDIITRFAEGVVQFQEKDMNFDGTADFFAEFDDAGQLLKTREDTSGNGRIDRVRHYRKGSLFQVENDHDGDDFFETVSLMENDRIDKNLIDKNHDGTPDVEVFFNDKQQRERLISDTDFNGKPDTWQYYTDDILTRVEKDENKDGNVDLVETYDENGHLKTLEERKQGRVWLTWYYGPGEILVRGEEDKNQDGAVEIWYLYENGRLTRVKEDTTLDGKPDLWETYDETQAMVKRERDLDFDGIPDFVETIEQAETDS
ncbi:MAG: hypothetical protein RQ739_00540 [Desulfotignum sp.]|nr:hypothetical protein [Desulfotignum sp.]